MIWKRGTINAYELGNGNYVDGTSKTTELIQSNTKYRETFEKAVRQSIAEQKKDIEAGRATGGITSPPHLIFARNAIKDRQNINAIMNQNEKAARLIKQKGLDNEKGTIIGAAGGM